MRVPGPSVEVMAGVLEGTASMADVLLDNVRRLAEAVENVHADAAHEPNCANRKKGRVCYHVEDVPVLEAQMDVLLREAAEYAVQSS